MYINVILIIGQKYYTLAINVQIILVNSLSISDVIFLKAKLLKKFLECIFKNIFSYFLAL